MTQHVPPTLATPMPGLRHADDVIDAEFVTLDAGGSPLEPGSRPFDLRKRASLETDGAPVAAGMRIFDRAAADEPAPRDDRLAFYVFGTMLVALSFWVSGGHTLASRMMAAPAPRGIGSAAS